MGEVLGTDARGDGGLGTVVFSAVSEQLCFVGIGAGCGKLCGTGKAGVGELCTAPPHRKAQKRGHIVGRGCAVVFGFGAPPPQSGVVCVGDIGFDTGLARARPRLFFVEPHDAVDRCCEGDGGDDEREHGRTGGKPQVP